MIIELGEETRLLKQWEKLQPYGYDPCCRHSHYWMPSVENARSGNAKSDDMVCPREVAWRKYVRVRDQNPNWPFNENPRYGYR